MRRNLFVESIPHGEPGFTLMEMLIVVSVLVVMAGMVVVLLNPVENLKKARDAQRVTDLKTIHNAVTTYLGIQDTTYLAGTASSDGCKGSTGYVSGDKIYYSYPSDSPGATITDSTLDGGSASIPAAGQVTAANLRKIDGTGWLPVELSKIGGGSPISHVPTDPTNTIASVASVSASDLVYRYACLSTNMTIEIDANLESDAYTTGTGNLEKTDGGNNDNLYEGGTNLSILGTGTDF